MSSDPDLLAAAKRQLDSVFEAMDGAAMIGWFLAWGEQDGVDRGDLADLVSEASARWVIRQGSGEV